MGAVSGEISFYPHLPSRVSECETRCLSHQFSPTVEESGKEIIIPSTCWVETAKSRVTDPTLCLIQRFWWPLMALNTNEFLNSCSICAHGKASHQAPAGLLHPLPLPCRPWSHIAVDFVTGLPPSEGNTTIRTIVDCFCKAIDFVPFPKLP